MLRSQIAIIGLFILFFSIQAKADWRLINKQSAVSFISTKNLHNSETHQFTQLSGTLNRQGHLAIEIDLASVETGIDIRNTRMREKLFLVDQFPTASLNAILPKKIMQLNAGQSVLVELPATLKLMQFEKPITVVAQVSKTTNGQVIATSTQAVLISASDFGLVPGLELLQQIAGLSSIGLTVPVSFNLTFAEN
jgi:polyisoprenoid-binding protein YceI